MRVLLTLAALLALSGCAGMEFVAVDYHSGHNYGPYVRPVGHISYTLGYYSGNYYNGWAVRGSHGHRYYYAPQHYAHHRHFTRPVVVQHVHVHSSYCEHNYRPRNNHRERDSHRNSYVQPQVRNDTRSTPPRNQTRNDTRRRDVTPPRRQPTRVVPQRQTPARVVPQRETAPRANNSRVERADRVERGRRNKNQKQKQK